MDPAEFERRMKAELRNERQMSIDEIMAVAKPIWESMGITEEEYMHRCKVDRKKIEEEEQQKNALQLSDPGSLQGEQDSA